MNTKEAFKARYASLHPLMILRSEEKSKTLGELFDILELVPTQYPLIWDDEVKRWVHTEDLLLSEYEMKEGNPI